MNVEILKMFKQYNFCIFCGSKRLELVKNIRNTRDNFYLKAIRSDLRLSKKKLEEKIKLYQCKKCGILQNNPWFNENFVKKIYSNIYGQHHRNWTNLLNFYQKGILPNHGKLFNLLNTNFKIKTYAEYNGAFMGLFLNFFNYENLKNKKLYKNYIKNIFGYLVARQVAGKNRNFQKTSLKNAKKFLNKINYFKNKNKSKNIKKILYTDNSYLGWGQNDNYKSVNSKSFAQEMFDFNLLEVNKKNKIKVDLFGIFHSLDHTQNPKKILDFALEGSKLVLVYAHIDDNMNKQHLFSLTEKFLKFLNNQKIYTYVLTEKIEKKSNSPEIYFICSKHKNYISTFKKNVLKKN